MAKLLQSLDIQSLGAALIPSTSADKPNLALISAGRRIVSLNLTTGQASTLAEGYDMAAALAVTPDGKGLYVADLDPAQRGFTLYAAALKAASRREARAIARLPGTPGQIVLSGSVLMYTDTANGSVQALNLETGKRSTLAQGLQSPVGLWAGAEGETLVVSESRAGRLIGVDRDGRRTVLRLGLSSPQCLTPANPGAAPGRAPALLVPQFARTGFVQVWTPDARALETLIETDGSDSPFAAWRLRDKLLWVGRRRVDWFDLLGRVPRPVTLSLAEPRPFIGAYQRVKVDLGSSGLTMAQLEFRIPSGEAGGQVSLSRDDLSAANEVMLLVGFQPGPHVLEAVDRTTHAVVASVAYEITDRWSDADRSPPHWAMGQVGQFSTGYTWGGGPGTPQNVDVIPQSGTRNVCVLTVDVNGARYPTGSPFDTIVTRWQNGAVGTTPDPDGKVRSAKAYYEEISQGAFTLALAGGRVLSIGLPTGWTDNFQTMPSPWPGNSFAPVNNTAFAQACISAAAALTDGAGNRLVDFTQVQTLVMVIRSQGSGAGDNFFWPQAWGGSFTVPGGSANIAVLGMPDDWDTVRDSRTIPETLSHEIGHNLGFPDLYTNANPLFTPDVISRDITNFDLMSNEGQLPHLSVAQKMEVGWVRPNWVLPLDFSRSTTPLDQTVTLHASELGLPPAGRFSAVEVRIADGWNYYFEYRRGQVAQIGDQELATNPGDTGNGVVLGTDVITSNFTFPIARPQVMRLRKDSDGENSFFTSGQDFTETDTSSMAVADFQMDVLSTAADSAQIRIRYGTNGRPDLSIRPWPGGENWQSPDIEVRNARSMADPAQWTNVPWVGHANTVIARYRNRGPVTARNVRVDFFIKDFTVGGAPEVPIGFDVRDVPPESVTPFVEFSTTWIPPSDGHKCLIARTPLYLDTSVTPTIVELSDSNNVAQSNYTRYIAASASPARRGITHVTLHNPFSQRAEIMVVPQIRGTFAAFYRVYLEHASLKLDPGESRKVQVMLESQYGDERLAAVWERLQTKLFREDTRVSLLGYGIPPDAPAHPVLLGGAQINVNSGRGTRFTDVGLQAERDLVRGRVVVAASGAPAPGSVLLTFRSDREDSSSTVKVSLDGQGSFVLRDVHKLAQKFGSKSLTAHYPGQAGYAPCDAAGPLAL